MLENSLWIFTRGVHQNELGSKPSTNESKCKNMGQNAKNTVTVLDLLKQGLFLSFFVLYATCILAGRAWVFECLKGVKTPNNSAFGPAGTPFETLEFYPDA